MEWHIQKVALFLLVILLIGGNSCEKRIPQGTDQMKPPTETLQINSEKQAVSYASKDADVQTFINFIKSNNDSVSYKAIFDDQSQEWRVLISAKKAKDLLFEMHFTKKGEITFKEKRSM